MHEISIMQSTLELAGEHARAAGGTAIARIRLRVGLMYGVAPEALEFAFEVLKKGTMAEDASLEIERVPGQARCSVCGEQVRLEEVRFDCPACNGLLILGEGGGELELSSLELRENSKLEIRNQTPGREPRENISPLLCQMLRISDFEFRI